MSEPKGGASGGTDESRQKAGTSDPRRKRTSGGPIRDYNPGYHHPPPHAYGYGYHGESYGYGGPQHWFPPPHAQPPLPSQPRPSDQEQPPQPQAGEQAPTKVKGQGKGKAKGKRPQQTQQQPGSKRPKAEVSTQSVGQVKAEKQTAQPKIGKPGVFGNLNQFEVLTRFKADGHESTKVKIRCSILISDDAKGITRRCGL